MCVFVCCLSVCREQANLRNYMPDFCACYVWFGPPLGSVATRHYVCSTSGFVDDVICAHSGPYGSMSIPLRRVTSRRRCAQANAPAASFWFRRVINDDGLRD